MELTERTKEATAAWAENVVYDGYLASAHRFCNIRIDDRDGGRQVGAHLRELGHRRVLCIADNLACMDRERYEGLCEGLGFRADFLKIPMQKTERMAFYQQRLPQLRQYSAIFAVSDYYAVDLMRFLLSSGVRLPEEISLVDLDDSNICRQTVPALTSVRQDGECRARTALQMLKRMRQEPDFSGDFLTPVRLVVRESTGRLRD